MLATVDCFQSQAVARPAHPLYGPLSDVPSPSDQRSTSRHLPDMKKAAKQLIYLAACSPPPLAEP